SRHAAGSTPGGTRSRPVPAPDVADLADIADVADVADVADIADMSPSPAAEPSGRGTAPAPHTRSPPCAARKGSLPGTAGTRADDATGLASSACISSDWLSGEFSAIRKAGTAP